MYDEIWEFRCYAKSYLILLKSYISKSVCQSIKPWAGAGGIWSQCGIWSVSLSWIASIPIPLSDFPKIAVISFGNLMVKENLLWLWNRDSFEKMFLKFSRWLNWTERTLTLEVQFIFWSLLQSFKNHASMKIWAACCDQFRIQKFQQHLLERWRKKEKSWIVAK